MTEAEAAVVMAQMREFHADAIAAGYENPLFGALVVATQVVVGVEREAPAGRHPKGKASGGV